MIETMEMQMEFKRKLPVPKELKEKFPLPENVKKKIKIIPVKHMDEVIKYAFDKKIK